MSGMPFSLVRHAASLQAKLDEANVKIATARQTLERISRFQIEDYDDVQIIEKWAEEALAALTSTKTTDLYKTVRENFMGPDAVTPENRSGE